MKRIKTVFADLWKFRSLFLWTWVILLSACGRNYLDDRSPQSSVEEAQLLLEDGQYLQARELLEAWLVNRPEDYKARGLYASTFAAEAGVSIIEITQRTLLGEGGGEEDILTSILPEATSTNLDLIKRTKDELASALTHIPPAVTESDINFGAGIYNTIYILLFTEVKLAQFDTEGISAEEAIDFITSTDQVLVFAEEANLPAEKIVELQAKLDAAPGNTEEERVESLLEQLRRENGGEIPELPAE